MRYSFFHRNASQQHQKSTEKDSSFFAMDSGDKDQSPDRSFFNAHNASLSSGFFSGIQAKSNANPGLTIGQPGDRYEVEANAMADQVVQEIGKSRTSPPDVQRKCSACGEEEQLQKKETPLAEGITGIQLKPIFESEEAPVNPIQTKCEACAREEEEQVQAKAESENHHNAIGNLNQSLNSSDGSGSTLPEEVRGDMETAFGADFSKVKIHTHPKAVQMNRQLSARAFTHGSDIYFNEGKYNTTSKDGQRLLAHELTHVVQQGKAKTGANQQPSLIQKQEVCEPEEATYDESTHYDDENGVCYMPEEEMTDLQVNQYASIPFYSTAEVTPELGIRLHTTPSPQDPDYVSKTGRASDHLVQPRGSKVTITGIGVEPHKGWAKVMIKTGETGWIEARFLSSSIPLPKANKSAKEDTKPKKDSLTKELHHIEAGDTLEGLIKNYYKDYNYQTGNDRRTIAHAFYILNEDSPGVRLTGDYESSFFKDAVLDRGFAGSREIYGRIQLFQGYWVRFPTTAYINMQRSMGAVSTRADWKNQAIAIGRGIQGFYEGVHIGFLQAGVDMVVDLWDLVKDIFTGAIFEKGYDLVMQFIDLYEQEGIAGIWRVVSGFFKGIYKSFVDSWNNPNPRERWKFIGKIVGMILFEIALAFLTAGAGTAAKWSARIAKAMKKFPALTKIVNAGSKGLQKVKGTAGKAIDKAKSLRNKRKLGFDDDQWKNYMQNKGVHWDDIKNKPELVKLEMDALKKSDPGISTVEGYDIEIKVPNGHIYRRRKPPQKGWCRFSGLKQGCGEIPVDTYIEKNKIARVEEDLGFHDEYLGPYGERDYPPGYKKQNPKTALGTFVHSKAYKKFIDWLDTPKGKQWLKNHNYTKADLALDLPKGKLSREFPVQHPDYPPGRKPRIDVVDEDNAKVYEIKPDTRKDIGKVESQQYAEWMNKYHPRSDGKLWEAGETIVYDAKKVYNIFQEFGFFE